MRMKSVYACTCDRCHADIESTGVSVTCPKCGQVIRLEWDKPATLEPKK